MAGPLRKKELFFNLFFQRSKISTAIKLEGGGGGEALMVRSLRVELFLAASLREWRDLLQLEKRVVYCDQCSEGTFYWQR